MSQAPSRVEVWLKAFRLHTLPLAIAGIGLGNVIAQVSGKFSWVIAICNFCTAICLQILSNLANDYGDTIHGADNEERVGPARMVQQGLLTKKQIRNGIVVFIFLSLAFGVSLLVASRNNMSFTVAMIMLGIGVLSIIAAIAYTATKKPYGYHGFGDPSVFIFFGLVSVYGSYYLQTGVLDFISLLPAASIGLLSAGVLNVNNIRDIETDRKANKKTIAVRLRLKNAKIYHFTMMATAFILMDLYFYLLHSPAVRYIFLIPAFLFIRNALGVWEGTTPQQIAPYLKQLVLSTLLFTVTVSIGLIFF